MNWGKAATDQTGMEEYQSAIDRMIRQEVNLVMTGVCKFATQLLPLHKKNTSFCDSELQRLCEDSKQMWSESTGDSLKRAVHQRINTLEAIKEKNTIQQQFKNCHPKRFS